MGLLIPKSFWFLTIGRDPLNQIQQFKTLDKTAARKRIIDNIYAFLAERLKAANILSSGVVELGFNLSVGWFDRLSICAR